MHLNVKNDFINNQQHMLLYNTVNHLIGKIHDSHILLA